MAREQRIRSGRIFPSIEPTIWALRKKGKRDDAENVDSVPPSLYEHIYGYDPIKVVLKKAPADKQEEAIRKGSAENPALNILNPQTGFMVRELASEEESED